MKDLIEESLRLFLNTHIGTGTIKPYVLEYKKEWSGVLTIDALQVGFVFHSRPDVDPLIILAQGDHDYLGMDELYKRCIRMLISHGVPNLYEKFRTIPDAMYGTTLACNHRTEYPPVRELA